MSYAISKELFEAVMGGYEYISPHNGGIIYCWKDSDGLHNEKAIYPNDFFFKCKEWALKQGYYITTSQEYCCTLNKNSNLCHEDICCKSEQQYCFDACQWILDNKDR